MVVQGCSTLVETSCVPRVRVLEQVEVEMVTELVAERVEERAERGDVFAYRRSHP